jgi:tetratricopeptide (TPR) repeat protein
VPAAVRRALERALSPTPAQRFATMVELIDALERSLGAGARRTITAVAVVATAAVAGVLAFGDDRCRPERVPVWDDSARAQLRATFAEEAWGPAVERVVDRRVTAWHEAASRSCALQQHEPARAAAALRCLDVRRLELDAAIELVIEGAPDVLSRAVEVVSRLPAAEPCATASDPRLALADPAALVEETRALRSELARARSLGDAGRYDQATAIAAHVLARAEESGHAPLRVEATLRLGALRTLAGAPAEAEPLLESAYFDAREIGHDEVVADAALELVEGVGVRQARADDGEVWLAHAAAALERWGSTATEAELARKRGALAQRRADTDEALAQFGRALELWQQVADESDPRLARAFDDLGIAHIAARRWDLAMEHILRGLTLRENIYGPDHPATAYSLNNAAIVLMETDQLDTALDWFEWVVALNVATYGPEHPYVGAAYNNVGAVWGRMGEPAIAAQAFAAGLPAYERLGPDHPDLAMALGNVGTAALDSGDLPLAFDALERALAIEERGGENTSTRAYAAALGLAAARIGAHARAISLLERGLTGDEPPRGYGPGSIALMQATLGRSRLARGDRDGAARALVAARAELAQVSEPATEVRAETAALARGLGRTLEGERAAQVGSSSPASK